MTRRMLVYVGLFGLLYFFHEDSFSDVLIHVRVLFFFKSTQTSTIVFFLNFEYYSFTEGTI
jgi:hypothetical protein